MKSASVITVPVLQDNYSYIVQSPDAVIVIDPGEAAPVISMLDKMGRRPDRILITHYDYDHIDGVDELVRRFHPEVIGPEPARVSLTSSCCGGDEIAIGDQLYHVIDTPGHYIPHVAFYMAAHGWLFSADCLFGSGCGRVRNNAYREMYQSLQTLASLPDDTFVYFGHEYTLSNLAFAASVEPSNSGIARYQKQVVEKLSRGEASSPSTISIEKKTNPFLRTSSPEIRQTLGLIDASDEEVFTALRKAKDRYAG